MFMIFCTKLCWEGQYVRICSYTPEFAFGNSIASQYCNFEFFFQSNSRTVEILNLDRLYDSERCGAVQHCCNVLLLLKFKDFDRKSYLVCISLQLTKAWKSSKVLPHYFPIALEPLIKESRNSGLRELRLLN